MFLDVLNTILFEGLLHSPYNLYLDDFQTPSSTKNQINLQNRSTMHKRLLLFITLFLLFQFPVSASTNEGKVIAFAGISGCGKSTLCRELAKLMHAESLCEPEENQWPAVTKRPELTGSFSAWMGLRNMWIINHFEAEKIKKTGSNVVLDTMFLKLLHYELFIDEMGILMDPNDLYYSALCEICLLDINYVPDPDVIVLFHISKDDWIEFILKRNRNIDQSTGFIDLYEPMTDMVEKSCENLSLDKGIRIVHFDQKLGDPKEEAERLYEILVSEGLI